MTVSLSAQIAAVEQAIRAAPAAGKALAMTPAGVDLHRKHLSAALETLRAAKARERRGQ